MPEKYRPLYAGCFGQHFLQTIWSDKVPATVQRKFCLVLGKVAGADGLSESEIQLAVDTAVNHWNMDGDRTAEAVRSDIEEGVRMSAQEVGLLIWGCSQDMGLTDPTPLMVGLVQYSLAVSTADGLTTTEKDSLKELMMIAGMKDEIYEK
eukprot:EG_transcript_41062